MTRPGVYVSEAPLPRIITGTSPVQSYGAFIGTALRGPTTPVLVRSWSDFVSTFGDYGSTVTLPTALNQYFTNTGTPAYVSRVIQADSVTASATFVDSAVDRLMFTAVTGGTWGNALGIIIRTNSVTSTFELQVLELIRGSWVTQERFPNLSMVTTSPRYVLTIVNSQTIGSRLLTVADVVKDSAPLVAGTSSRLDLAGGTLSATPLVDADYTAAITQFDAVDGMLVLNIPKVEAIAGCVSYVESRGDSVIILDTGENETPTNVVNTAFPASSYTAVYYPWIHVADQDPAAARGSVRKVPPGASVVGMILSTDARRGIFKAPAGIGASLSGALATETRITNADLDKLAVANVNVIRPIPGSGITVMGARTNGTATTTQYLSVRRILNYVKKQAVESSRFALFEPNSPGLWDQLRVINGSFLAELWRAGGLQGSESSQAFYVKIDRDNNTAQTIANGEVHIEIGVAPVYPAEFIIIRVGQFESDASTIVTEEV